MAVGIQRGLFATHRGRLVKRGGLTLAGLAVGMFLLSGIVNGGSGETQTKAAVDPSAVVDPSQVDTTPEVSSFVSNPFRAQANSYYTVTGGAQASAVDGGGTGSGTSFGAEPSQEASSDSSTANADTVTVKRVAQTFAMAWGSWAPGKTPEAYVSSLPSVKPGAEASLATAVKARSGAGTTGSLSGASPIMDSFDGTAGRASVEVPVVEGSLDEGGAAQTVTYKVTLERYSASSGDDIWGVTAISSL